MDQVKAKLENAKETLFGQSAEQGANVDPSGTAHKTAGTEQTGTGVVRSLEEAGHRMQEQQGADNPGRYDAQAELKDTLEGSK
ncbi:beta-ketoacyl synthase [Chlorella sorokiniana]|uniref:Beta-ketoacyl synthase n=1 Tax=Chlorella sorokiniana TaxID=3076 RepID=A0A2P6THF2_CHLSO|nr:beta-ketoacyl synthase [Chlorella sorokiniana]|eukprot:PRW33717.1 beta-ketoacyl synthase [Chlorella sorokiniana]